MTSKALVNLCENLHTLLKVKVNNFALHISRTPLTLYIGIDSIKAVTKDGKVVLLSYEVQELKDFLLCQVSTTLAHRCLIETYLLLF